LREGQGSNVPAPVIAVLNLKGGVGKTTLAAHVFREVFTSKRVSILLIDLDPQFNLSQQLLAQSRYNSLVAEDKTALRLFEPAPTSDFFDVNVVGNDPPAPSSLSARLRYLVLAPETLLSLICGTFELTKYSFIEDHAKLAHARNFFKRAISKARAEFGLVILDLNPSSSFLTFCGLSVATDILSPVRPDKFSVLGLDLVRRLIDHPLVTPKPALHIVMNGVKRGKGITAPEREIRTADYFKNCILTNRIYESGVLVARPDYTGFASERGVSNRYLIASELRQVGLELCQRIGL
jgi:chromosome partitioning protein